MTRWKLPYNTAANLATYLAQAREIFFDTTNNEARIGDGSTLGGKPLAFKDGTNISVTATGGSTARTLAARFAEVYRPEDYGAIGDGTTDDTTAFQAALTALGEGDVLVLTAGATYSVKNITLPTNNAAATSNARNGMICVGGMATIKCRAGGDTAYLCATDRWLTSNSNKAFSGTPWFVQNIIFDGNAIASRAVVSKNYWSIWDNCYFKGATSAQFEYTRQNQDTSAGTNSQYITSEWNRCRFITTGGTYGLRSKGTAASDLDANTDSNVRGCDFQGSGSYGLYIGNGGGWTIAENRFYSQTTAGFYVGQLSRGMTFADNNVDTDDTGTPMGGIIGEATLYPDAVIGPGNVWYASLQVNFKADSTAERLKIIGDHFAANVARSAKAKVIHNYNDANKELWIENCTFDADPIYTRGSGVTAGLIEVRNCTSASASGNAQKIAYLRDDPSATAGPVVRNVRMSASPAASDVIARHEHIGQNASAALITYAATETAIVDATAGSEDAKWRAKIQVAGAETTGLEVDGFGLTVLSKPMWRVIGASGVASSITGTTTPTALATVTIPAGAMGANGLVRVTTNWTITNSANNKTLRVFFGGTGGTLYKNVVLTTTAIDRHQCEIHNRNATNSQTGYNSGGSTGGWGTSTSANQTSAIDTTAAVDIVIQGTLANTGETITLESYLVELLYQV